MERQTDGAGVEPRFGDQSRIRGVAESGGRGRVTSGRAEAIEPVLVVAGGGGAPAVAVRTTFGGAGGVGAALEGERKHAGLAVRIAVQGVESWGGPYDYHEVLRDY